MRTRNHGGIPETKTELRINSSTTNVIHVDIYECKCGFKIISVSKVVNITIFNVSEVHTRDLIAVTFLLPFGPDTRINLRG